MFSIHRSQGWIGRYGFYLSLRFAEVVQILRRIIFVSRAGLGVPDRSFF